MCWSYFRTECIAYLVHLSSPYKYADKQSAPGRSLPNGSNSSVVRGESCDTCVSPLLCLLFPLQTSRGHLEKAVYSKKLWFGHSGNGARRNFLWVNTEEKGKATFTWIIKFSVLRTEYKLAPPIVTNEGCLSENRRADSQRGLVGRPQPRPSCIHHPLNQSTNSTPPFVINYANQPTITLRWHCSCY